MLIAVAALCATMPTATTGAMAADDGGGKSKAAHMRHGHMAGMGVRHRHLRRVPVYRPEDGGERLFSGRFFPTDGHYGYCYDAQYGYYGFGACNFIGH
jgi:hypothetical protein